MYSNLTNQEAAWVLAGKGVIVLTVGVVAFLKALKKPSESQKVYGMVTSVWEDSGDRKTYWATIEYETNKEKKKMRWESLTMPSLGQTVVLIPCDRSGKLTPFVPGHHMFAAAFGVIGSAALFMIAWRFYHEV